MRLIKNSNQLQTFLQLITDNKQLCQIEINHGFELYKITGTIYSFFISYSGKVDNPDIFADNMFIQHVIKDCFEDLGFKIILDFFEFDYVKIDGTVTFSFGISSYEKLQKGGEE